MRWQWSALIASAFVTSVSVAQGTTPFAATVQDLLRQRASAVDLESRPVERRALDDLYYGSAGLRPLWTDDRGPTPQALQAIEILASSDLRGLPSASYDVATLRVLAADAAASPVDAARFDLALSESIGRLLAHLHMGRLDPTSVRFDLPSAHDQVDLPGLITAVARAGDVTAVVDAAEPVYAGYRALTRTLRRYRALAADTTLRAPARAATTIRPGDGYADVPALARFLRALGDVDHAVSDASASIRADSAGVPVYEGALVEAVRRFQRRHGLDPDGALGPATMAQLRMPLARRVRQIELTMERWRWLPERPPVRYIVVNIPGFRLYAFEGDPLAAHAVVSMDVIVGQADRRHNTPVFSATMRDVVFRPYWDVPPRIARVELIPMFRRRPRYFETEGFEIVGRGTGDVAAETFPPTEASFARIIAGELRLRQRPGPANALGLVKFVFPNRYNVYLHDTPTRSLFAHSRRDYSHGCIRIAKPSELAELVLAGQGPWTRETVSAAMNGDRTLRVPIERPVSVFVLYATAVVDTTGVVHFYRDLYGHDAALERALQLPAISAGRELAAALDGRVRTAARPSSPRVP